MIFRFKSLVFMKQNQTPIVSYVDYKDIELLKKFLNPHARMISRRKSGLSAKNQRQIALAIKRARFLGLLPFVAR